MLTLLADLSQQVWSTLRTLVSTRFLVAWDWFCFWVRSVGRFGITASCCFKVALLVVLQSLVVVSLEAIVKFLLQVIVLVGMFCFLQLEVESLWFFGEFLAFTSYRHVGFLVPPDEQQSVEVKREPSMIVIVRTLFLTNHLAGQCKLLQTLKGWKLFSCSGMAIFDTMRHIRCDVSTVCVGLAASMGAFLLSGGTKG